MPKKKKTNKKDTTLRLPFPRMGTTAAENFYESWGRINNFFHWVLHMAVSMDRMRDIAVEALKDKDDPENSEDASTRKGMIDVLRENRQFFLEVILVRHIENYLNYISELLYEIFIGKPETLRSSDKVEIARVLEHASIRDFVLAAAQRKVDSLSYSAFSELSAFFDARFGLTLVNELNEPLLVEAIEIRNISVHNRCVINERFCKRIGLDESLIGTRREIYVGTLDDLMPLLFDLVKALDKSARRKLKLKGRRFDISERLGESSEGN